MQDYVLAHGVAEEYLFRLCGLFNTENYPKEPKMSSVQKASALSANYICAEPLLWF